MDGQELLVVGVAGEADGQDVQVRLTDPGHLTGKNITERFTNITGTSITLRCDP